MATLIKLIWRFDYEPSYSFLNRKGDVLRALSEEVPEYLTNLKFNDVNGLNGDGKDDVCRRNINMDVTSLTGIIDFMEEVPIETAFKTAAFRNSDTIMRALIKTGELSKIKRGGIRFFILMPVAPGARTDTSIISEGSVRLAADSLGSVSDVAAVLEGRGADGLSYRLQYGRLEPKNVEQLHASPIPEHAVEKASSGKWLIADVDLYEENFTLVAQSLFGWAKTKLAKVENLTKLIELEGRLH